MVPYIKEVKDDILNEAHRSMSAIHPGSTKNVREKFWSKGMKREIAEFVSG